MTPHYLDIFLSLYFIVFRCFQMQFSEHILKMLVIFNNNGSKNSENFTKEQIFFAKVKGLQIHFSLKN